MEEWVEEERPLPEVFKELVTAPVRILTSPTSQRFFIRSLLLFIVSVALTVVSVFAYLALYYQYIPALGLTLPVYLQFHPSTYHPSYPQHSNYHHPFAAVQLPRGALASGQKYNVKVQLCMPHAPQNVDAGNFMIDVELLGPDGSYFPPVNSSESRNAPLLAREARPAILAYTNPVVGWAQTLLMAPLQVTGFVKDQLCLDVPVMDGLAFGKGWRNQPESARVEVRSAIGLRIYSVSIEFSAVFSGLRWLMYNHRIISFTIFTTVFWTVAMGSAMSIWLVVSYLFEPRQGSRRAKSTLSVVSDSEAETIKKLDEGDTSDSRIKREDDDEVTTGQSAREQVGAEADDEDEEDDFVLDEPGMQSGLGGSGSTVWGDDTGVGTSLERSGSSSSGARARRRDIKQEADL